MHSCFDVAKYFLAQSSEDAGDLISNLKLQKLVYYAQGFSLALNGRPLFNEQIEAWLHGPVVPELYHQYKACGSGHIPHPDAFDLDTFSVEERELLDEVYEFYGQYSAWRLRQLTHDETPWRESYREGSNQVISQDSMARFFETQVVH
ncbi:MULTISPECIES: Panacea domain-containing protein [Pseudomonas]|uniref:Panacea domain-containing protein n=1 Tax=Pseudomonas TaxID=286 RepID=UPI00257E8FAE|nr:MULTISPECIES: type II toxin-antitoxin system antitoxin SocA domain-containing protein [Pseudomonas]